MELTSAAELSDQDMLAQILHYEKVLDQLAASERIFSQDLWDAYFGLLHECDIRGFKAERRRILAKIDTTQYNPFKSDRPEVHLIARLRLARFKIPSALDN